MANIFNSDISDFVKRFVQSICNSYRIKDTKEVAVKFLRYSKSTPKGCYENARKYVMQNPESRYVLGYMFYNGEIPIEHAWIRKNGVDFDVTVKPEPTNIYVAFVDLDKETMNKIYQQSSAKAVAIYDYFRAQSRNT